MASKTERFSSNIQMTLEDFTTSGWEETFVESQRLAISADALAKRDRKRLKKAIPPKAKPFGSWLTHVR